MTNRDERSADRRRLLWAGNTLLSRVVSIRRVGKRLGDRKLLVTLRNGDVYTIAQLDRGYFEVDGPHLKQCPVLGWNDGLRLVDNI